MTIEKNLSKEIQTSIAWTAGLTVLFILFNRSVEVLWATFLALPFFIALYFLIFSIGKEQVSNQIRNWLNSDIKKIVIFPAALIVLYFGYVFIIGQNPFQGAVSLIPFLVFFPVLVFAAQRKEIKKIDWLDFTTFIVFLLPITLIDAKPAGNLPNVGHDFDSVYRIVMMLTAVYAFVTVRGLNDVGFFPEFKIKKLFTALWVWLAFYGIVFIVGYSVDFIQIKGHETFSAELISKISLAIITTFLHTALFEELFFRGLLQNMLSKRINQSNSWMTFWKWGLAILFPLAILVGYTLKGAMQWFPALITLLMFLAAFFIEKSGKFQLGVYTALAITGLIFGLVHYHSGSIVYIGFACIAGWAYGYTWIKTRNVFYAALVHALVNSSVLIFGLEMMR
ncbi:MAG TPA: CPBP family intramembrane glutamic endopeptidase [Draconibacterium sp.]|nr:CPBP family intramembrane glutamic endopeptidase [Draconibacterium sp.]